MEAFFIIIEALMLLRNIKENIKQDFPASIVVFLVALPLCLGIAVGSGVPVISGLIAGVVGGIVVGTISNSRLSVSGPAAGLITTVSVGIGTVGSLEALFAAVMIAGIVQIILASFRAGIIGGFIPNSVINGMLVAIGLMLILKQLPHLVGYDVDFEGDEAFRQPDGQNTFSELFLALRNVSLFASALGISGILIQILWDRLPVGWLVIKKWLPGPLVVVLTGGITQYLFEVYYPDSALPQGHLVNVPDILMVIKDWKRPDLKFLLSPEVLTLGVTIGIIASIESLLSIEATDKLDPEKHITSTNRELFAQGTGNLISGFLGGLPVTAVIVRSSANINAGAKSKISAILHGILLCLSIYLFPRLLGKIPLASLAAILIYVGYKLAKPSIFKSHLSGGKKVYIPFLLTILAIILTDLLKGVLLGLIFGLFFALKDIMKKTVIKVNIDNNHLIQFLGSVSFLNKSIIKHYLEELNSDENVIFDFSRCTMLDSDIQELIADYYFSGKDERSVELKFLNAHQQQKLFDKYKLENKDAGAH